jgi:hypothetical protein
MKKNGINRFAAYGLILLTVLLLNGCEIFMDQIVGSGNRITEERKLGSFNGITAGSAFDIIIERGETPGLLIEADDNLMRHIITEVRGKTLKISTEVRFRLAGKIKVYITYDKLEEIKLSGAAELQSEDVVEANDFLISLSGASMASLQLQANDLQAKLSGASKLYISGVSDEIAARLSGASRLFADQLETHEGSYRLSGSSKAEVWVVESIDARASGASRLVYAGNPRQINSNTSGAASISKK